KDAIIYELHVKSFFDSVDDGIGDFRGLIQKLDYLEGLGINCIWLLPFYPSPLKDDGYDISDYFNIHSSYGALRDFRLFLKQAHRRNMRVITELVLNHTSDQHLWFQRARSAPPGSIYRDYYVWSDTPDKYKDARIIFKDFENSNWSWDPVAKSYYWHRFYSHQPDLNFDNRDVQREIFNIIDFWFKTGVDGLRLDAVPYLFEEEGTNCENLPKTHLFLKNLRKHIDKKFKNRMLLAEANQWPEDSAKYFGSGDECHMAFHFPIMPRMFMAVQMEDSFPIIDIFEQTPQIPENSQWALFLRNHDELTLEMVTEEERDYMYRAYAQDSRAKINLGIRRRLAPLLNNNRKKIELLNILLFSLPGTPVIYYGDEIGMGDNYHLGDRNGVRTPMQWSPDRNAGFSRANPQNLYLPLIIDPEYHYEAINVENQEKNLSSLLWWMKRVIAMRKKFKAFSRGDISFVSTNNPKILAFSRKFQDEIILIVINLSRFSQVVDLGLSQFAGFVPEEVFSQNKFPPIRNSPYTLILGSYNTHWLLLTAVNEKIELHREAILKKLVPEITIKRHQLNFQDREFKNIIQKIIPDYLKKVQWFTNRFKTIYKIRIVDQINIVKNTCIFIFEIGFTEGPPELYLIPVSIVSKSDGLKLQEEDQNSIIAKLLPGKREYFLCDAFYDEKFRKSLLSIILKEKKIKGEKGEIIPHLKKNNKNFITDNSLLLSSTILKSKQHNALITYGTELLLKSFRRLDYGLNPELEIERILKFSNIPQYAGSIEYNQGKELNITLCVLSKLIPHQGDVWSYTLDAVSRFYSHTLSKKQEIKIIPKISGVFSRVDSIPQNIEELIRTTFLGMIKLLGIRTAELHLALTSVSDNPDFVPEHFSMLYQRSVYQSMRNQTRRAFSLLLKNINDLPRDIQDDAQFVLKSEKNIINYFQKIYQNKLSVLKMRIHGNYHLEQILFTGKDFIIADFEGDTTRPISERRLKRSPLRDIAGIIRSFHYVALKVLYQHPSIRKEDMDYLEDWANIWWYYVSNAFLKSYIDTIKDKPIVPEQKDEFDLLLNLFILNKAIYELEYELINRSSWVIIPIKGIKHFIENYLT
ncbi:MAG: maltose alpha-D-glucosyltransferase, partial [Candidatus Hydrogenedentota bacterium]